MISKLKNCKSKTHEKSNVFTILFSFVNYITNCISGDIKSVRKVQFRYCSAILNFYEQRKKEKIFCNCISPA